MPTPGAENTYRPDAEPGPLQAPELPPGSAAWEPKPELWGSDPAKGKNGLPPGTVVLDVVPHAPGTGTTEPVRPLREVLEALGRQTFGAQGWNELGPLVRGAFRHERLGALLTGMSHGIDLRSPLLVRTGERDALVLAGAKVQKLEYVREFEKDAELNVVNEWAAGGGVRENTFHTAGGQLQGGPEFKPPAPSWGSPAGSATPPGGAAATGRPTPSAAPPTRSSPRRWSSTWPPSSWTSRSSRTAGAARPRPNEPWSGRCWPSRSP